MTAVVASRLQDTVTRPGAARLAPFRAWVRRVARRLGLVSPERWWLLLFAILFLAFFVILLFQPTIGRGGR